MDPAILLVDDAFARKLAVALLRDRDAAEDLVQEAWLSFLEHPPRHAGNPHGYLRTLLRRLVLRGRRSTARRVAREQSRTSESASPSAEALVARAEIHQRTVAAVLTLEEPYRSTVLLRYFEDLGPEAIALREDLPLETVRTRLRRALQRLRRKLEREGGDWRSEWAIVLAPHTTAGRNPGSATGRFPRGSRLWFGAGLVALGGLGWWTLSGPRGERPPTNEPRGLGPVALPGGGNEGADREAVSRARALGERARISAGSPESTAETRAAGRILEGVLEGRVTDSAGQVLEGASLWLVQERFDGPTLLARARTDAGGRVSLSLDALRSLPAGALALAPLVRIAWKPGHHLVRTELELAELTVPFEIELAPGRSLTAQVSCEGRRSGGVQAMVRIQPGEAARAPRIDQCLTDQDGLLVIDLEPGERLIELALWDSARGFLFLDEARLPANLAGDVDLGSLSLDPGRELRGRCVHPDGSPARHLPIESSPVRVASGGGLEPLPPEPRARLAEGLLRLGTRTDAEGAFRIRGLRDGLYQVLMSGESLADAAGTETALVAGGVERELAVPNHRVLVEVLAPDGRPLEDARVAGLRWPDGASAPRAPARSVTSGDPPLAGLAIDPGETLTVLALVPGFAPLEEQVRLEDGRSEVLLSLRLVSESSSAGLRLETRGAHAGDPSRWRVRLLAPLSGLALARWKDLEPGPAGLLRDLPAGRYRVCLTHAPDDDDDPLVVADALEVELVAGEVTTLVFTPVPGAVLRLAEPSDEPPALAGIHGERELDEERMAWLMGAMMAPRARLQLLSLDSGTQAPLPADLGTGTRDIVVAPGRYRLHLERAGAPTFERELSLIAGETLELNLPPADADSRLEPRSPDSERASR